MFNTLSKNLTTILEKLTKKGIVTEQDVTNALREVRISLLEADVALEVVKNLIENIRVKATGQSVIKSVTPGQQVIKIVNDELINLLGSENTDLNFVIEYKPREPRVKMSYDSVSRTILGIEKIGLPNIGLLLDFGHAIYGGESAADSAQLAIDYGRLFGMDVNDNFRSWDDDLLAGSLHPIELFEFFYVLRKNNWQGVWQLDQFPFREDSVVMANMAIDFLKAVDKALDDLDIEALTKAQANHDAMAALKIAQKALYKHLAK